MEFLNMLIKYLLSLLISITMLFQPMHAIKNSATQKKSATAKVVTIPEQISTPSDIVTFDEYYDLNNLTQINTSNAALSTHYSPNQKAIIKHAPLMIFTDPEGKENNETPIEKLFFTLMLRDIIIDDWNPLLLVQFSLFEQLISHFHHHLFADLRKKYIFFEIKKSSFVLLVPHWYLLFYQEDHGIQFENLLNKNHLLSYTTIKNSTNIFTWLTTKKEKLSKYDDLGEIVVSNLRNIFIPPQLITPTPYWDIWIAGDGQGKETEEQKARKIAGLNKNQFADFLQFCNNELSSKSLYIFSSHVGGTNKTKISKAIQSLKNPLNFSCIISDNYETEYKLKTTTELTTHNILQLIPAINVASSILPRSFTQTIKQHFNLSARFEQNKQAVFNNLTKINDILDGQIITPLLFDPTIKNFNYPPVDDSFFLVGDLHLEAFPVQTVVPENKRVVFANHSRVGTITISPFSLTKKIDLYEILQKLQLGAAYINSLEKNDQSSYQLILTKVFNYAKNEFGYSSDQLQLLTMPSYETFQAEQYLFPKFIFTQTPNDLGMTQECHIKELILKSSQPLMGGIHQCLCDAFTGSQYPFTRVIAIEKITGFDDISNVVATARTSADFSHVFYTNRNKKTEIERALEKQKKERKSSQVTLENVLITTEGNQNSVTFSIDSIEYEFKYSTAPFKITRFYQSENE
jgi:hypothetical protein